MGGEEGEENAWGGGEGDSGVVGKDLMGKGNSKSGRDSEGWVVHHVGYWG